MKESERITKALSTAFAAASVEASAFSKALAKIRARTVINCRFCGGPREANGISCLSCGSPIANAMKRETKPGAACCPRCQSTRHRNVDDHVRRCGDCGTEYEPRPDFICEDLRPERNAIRKGL